MKMNRLLGLGLESAYGSGGDTVDFHQGVNKANFGVNQDTLSYSYASRMTKGARGGYIKPKGSSTTNVDLQRIQHYLYALLGNYKYTAGTTALKDSNNRNVNIHEFWGDDTNLLPSLWGTLTYDLNEKTMKGLLLDEYKLTAKDDYATDEATWIYMDESNITIDANTYVEKDIIGTIPTAGYDYKIKFDGDYNKIGIVSEMELTVKNNHNVDGTIGLGSRKPQKKAVAQNRDIELSLTTTLDSSVYKYIIASEYGVLPTDPSQRQTPSACQLYELPCEISISACEDPNTSLRLVFPACLFSVDEDISGSDEIEVKLTLNTLGTNQVTLNDGTTKYTSDFYAILKNGQTDITV